jgi:hypothetical protein
MLKEEELAFIKAISTCHLSHALLPELRKALVAGKSNALVHSKASIFSVAEGYSSEWRGT